MMWITQSVVISSSRSRRATSVRETTPSLGNASDHRRAGGTARESRHRVAAEVALLDGSVRDDEHGDPHDQRRRPESRRVAVEATHRSSERRWHSCERRRDARLRPDHRARRHQTRGGRGRRADDLCRALHRHRTARPVAGRGRGGLFALVDAPVRQLFLRDVARMISRARVVRWACDWPPPKGNAPFVWLGYLLGRRWGHRQPRHRPGNPRRTCDGEPRPGRRSLTTTRTQQPRTTESSAK